MITADKLSWYYHRLRAMGPEEIAGRVVEKARTWTERSALDTLDEFKLGIPADHHHPHLPDRKNAPQIVCDSLQAECAQLRQGKWKLYGWEPIDTGIPPFWARDYHRQADAPLDIEASRLDQRRLPSGADARTVWEINRWSELVRLAQNAWLNGNLDDARLAQQWVLDWCNVNPVSYGINWTSALEAALRLTNFCWMDSLIRACNDPELTSAQQELAKAVVPSHAWWVWRHKSFGSSANNHLLGELSALVIAARRWPCLVRLTACAEHVWQRMEEEIVRQFAEDGGNREQALHYHLFAWEMGWQAYRSLDLPAGPAGDRLRAAATFFTEMAEGDGRWEFGDSDDAQITPWTLERSSSSAEWKAWFEEKDAGASIRFWLGTPPKLRAHEPTGGWSVFPQSGLAIIRQQGWTARTDASPLGFGSMAAHGHLDALHTSLWMDGRPVLIDPGTGAYFGDTALREHLSSWEMHNGPMPSQGRLFPKRMGPFLWANHHEPPKLDIEEGICVMRFSCDGPFIKRSVQITADGVQITDEVTGFLKHQVIWQLAPGWVVEGPMSDTFLFSHPEGGRLKLTVESAQLHRSTLLDRQVSPHFGSVCNAVALQLEFHQRLTCLWQKA